ncbi:hypothetical protein ROSEINA2194_03376 [Roseburia inulinivorans DSM 16841]|uniref:Uncharacterized protein n=1 Tax=Roseburia inulinivorans DSM 16841 TaxID=622312 RepID=C0FX96_9FIRM|nr:hypothetical protein ROSEINA2194_03376 [Roseburia inulinivorans DSM 16841]
MQNWYKMQSKCAGGLVFFSSPAQKRFRTDRRLGFEWKVC